MKLPKGRTSKGGFTLVELLVVITIVAVLLALLAPALDKAIYQAELAACAANQKGTTAGILIYAHDFKRFYPFRPGHSNRAGHQPRRIKSSLIYDPRLAFDDRIAIKRHVDLKLLVCPLTGKIDLGFEANDNLTGDIFAPYNLWFGLHYSASPAGPQKGMLRLGDRFTWSGSRYTPESVRFNVLTSDTDYIDEAGGLATATHPDDDRRMENIVRQNQLVTRSRETYSQWVHRPSFERPTIDQNYGFDDGAISRLDRVTWNDNRLVKVPSWANSQNLDTIYIQIPPAR